nr:immunoglobulin heavy chain junction region [Macaca mulatta]MOX58874.1 immunoglobulin heavy chain junction region [Macaca mulatta]MOX62115.1 immunoglobulin heavy chain junction region [Macaca mulatta]MOX64197.1 immunoglobulin heavy chain junction region [Macaca mulatta]MOX66159.1 immunoglobulin heavy chain junction region [Macaca mulatta]
CARGVDNHHYSDTEFDLW